MEKDGRTRNISNHGKRDHTTYIKEYVVGDKVRYENRRT
jgi:hypothetical protein